MDLEAAADDLYGGSPDTFIERRKELVAQARAAKDRELVKQIGALRRPTRSAWLVNRLSRGAATELAALLELGEQLKEAQRTLSGADLRRLSKQRQTDLAALTRRAVALGAESGHEASDAVRQEVSQTLQAALAEPGLAELVRTGRVTQAVEYGGFGGLEGLEAMAAGATARPDLRLVPDPPDDGPDEPAQPADPEAERAAQAERRRLEAAAAETAEALEAAQGDAETAQREADEATSRSDTLADEVEQLRERLRETETAEREARDRARSARKHAQEVAVTLRRAERAAADARAQLD